MKTYIKQLAFLVLLTLFFSCGNDDDAFLNKNPEEFNVTATADIKGLGIHIAWDISKDPNGDFVTYDIIVNSIRVAENLTTLSHSFLASAYNTIASGSVVAKDGKGGERNVPFTIVSSSLVHIPDPNFEAFLVATNIDQDGQINGQMNYQFPLEITILDIGTTLLNVNELFTDLTGIEAFANLTYFNCSHLPITKLDLSRNTKLESLVCSNTNLTSLDLSSNSNLKFFTGIANNKLTTIDFSKNLGLTEINLEGNGLLAALDVTENKALTQLNCGGTILTELNITQNIALTELNCGGTRITTIDLTKNTKLETLYCYESTFTSLDLSNNLLLETLVCAVNNITSLDVTANVNLKSLVCGQNNISVLDLTQNSVLEKLFCNSNELTSLNIKNGNSQNIIDFSAKNNTSLTSICIDVLVPVNPILASGVDTGVSFSTICN